MSLSSNYKEVPMLIDHSDTSLTQLLKISPEFQPVIQNMLENNKKSTSILVHELRNPLSLLKGTIQFIESKNPDVKSFKYWDQMEELVNDMEQIMVDASLLNAYHSLQIEVISFSDYLHGIINNFMPKSIEHGIHLSLIIQDSDLDFLSSIPCDSAKLKHVFNNLIKNAFEATTEGNYISLEVSTFTEQDERYLMIQVSNNGLSIPSDEIDHIFKPFVTYKKGGTGVGLAISKRIIDLHYGTITAASDENTTSFTITLPVDLLTILAHHDSLA